MNYRLAFSVRRAGRLRLFVSRIYVSIRAQTRVALYGGWMPAISGRKSRYADDGG